MKLLFLPGSFTSPAARFRIWQFVEPLRDMGHEVEVRVIRPDRQWGAAQARGLLRAPFMRMGSVLRVASVIWIARHAGRFDVVVMNRDLIPEVRISVLEPLLARMNPRLVFDLDDAIYLGKRDRKLRRILPHFSAVVAGNAELAGYLRQHNSNVHVIPTVADGGRYKPASCRPPGPLRIGWSGSAGPLRAHLPLVREAIEDLARDHEFEFVAISNERPRSDWHGVRTRFIEWRAENEVEDLQRLDIGLMPLTDGRFERGKCAAKAILYMAIGIPALVSAVGINTEVVQHGRTGFHCSDSAQWRDRLKSLLASSEMRRRMGLAGRARFEERYSLASVLPLWVNVLEQVASTSPARSLFRTKQHSLSGRATRSPLN